MKHKVTIEIESEATGDDCKITATFDPPARKGEPMPASHDIALRMVNAIRKGEVKTAKLQNSRTGAEQRLTLKGGTLVPDDGVDRES